MLFRLHALRLFRYTAEIGSPCRARRTGFGKGVQHAVQPLIDQIYQGVATPPGAIVSLAVAAPQSYALVGVAAMLASGVSAWLRPNSAFHQPRMASQAETRTA